MNGGSQARCVFASKAISDGAPKRRRKLPLIELTPATRQAYFYLLSG